jgi:tetratricopeptide (TPR) repeat protein
LLLAQAYGALGERDRALGYLDESALSPLSPEGDLAAEAERLKLRGLIHYFCREFAESVAANEKAVALARQGNLAHEVAICLHNTGDSLLHLGDYTRAYVALSQSLEACDLCGAERLASQNRMYVGYLDAVRGVPGGEAQLRSGISYAEEHNYSWDLVNGRYLLGLLLEQVGLLTAAAAELEACRATAKSINNRLIELLCAEAVARCKA